MIILIVLLAKATAVLAGALIATRLARHARASLRHGILLAAFVAIGVLPLAMWTLPVIEVAVLPARGTNIDRHGDERNVAADPSGQTPSSRRPARRASLDVAASAAVDPTTAINRPLLAAAVVWGLGAIGILAPQLIGIARIRRLRRVAIPCLEIEPLLAPLAASARAPATVDLLSHDSLSAPITCGVSRVAIILPPDARQWSEAAITRALIHELEHVKRRDWATQVTARAVCAVYWFHPLAWIAYRQLCLEAEHACDDAVVAREESTTYAEQLVALARRMTRQPAIGTVGMAHRSDLAARITAVLDTRKARGRIGPAGGMAIAASVAAALLMVAPLQLVAQSAQTQPRLSGEAASRPAIEPQVAGDAARKRASGPTVDGLQRQRTGERTPRPTRRDLVLIEAADAGELDEVGSLLDAGANVNAVAVGDGTALIVAARGGYDDLVRLLLDRGADVNLAVGGDGNPLIMAAREGHLQIVQMLLDGGADVDFQIPGDENPLIQASRNGHLAVVQLLLARGANVNARVWDQGFGDRDGEWRTPLSMARKGNHREVIALLLAHGAVE